VRRPAHGVGGFEAAEEEGTEDVGGEGWVEVVGQNTPKVHGVGGVLVVGGPDGWPGTVVSVSSVVVMVSPGFADVALVDLPETWVGVLVPCCEDSALDEVTERRGVVVDISDALVVDNATSPWFCDWELALGLKPMARDATAASAVAANTPTVLSTTDAGIRDSRVADAGGLTRAFSGCSTSSKGRRSSSGWSWERDGSSSHMRPSSEALSCTSRVSSPTSFVARPPLRIFPRVESANHPLRCDVRRVEPPFAVG
jgi:hypothetical protein